jgi:tetratricopeptide (TPR) repeat protein
LAKEKLRGVLDGAIDIANRGIELVLKFDPTIPQKLKKVTAIDVNKVDKIDPQNDADQNVDRDTVDQNIAQKVDHAKEAAAKNGKTISDPIVRLFFFMKYTFFHQLRGYLYQDIGEADLAVRDYEESFIGWITLIEDLDKLFLQRQYYVRELEAMRAMEAEHQFDGNYFENIKSMAEMERRVPPTDFFEDRWRYYVSELRGTLQRWALLELSAGKIERAGSVYRLDVNLARDMVRRKITNSDRFLVVSLLSYAKAMDVSGNIDESFEAFTEVLDLMLNRLSFLDCCLEDYEMFRHIMLAFSSFLGRSDHADQVKDLLEHYVGSLENFKLKLPDWRQWQELCSLPEIKSVSEEFKQRCNNLLKKHPEGTGKKK